MHLESGNLYHIYNRGNNRRPIFFNPDNYLYFITKMRRYLLPVCNILAYTLMPNHFHFLIEADERSVAMIINTGLEKSAFSEAIRIMLSGYTKGINKEQGFTGNLIQQKTKAKLLTNKPVSDATCSYASLCFHYIHQNAYRAQLVSCMEDWEYSSFRDYAGLRNGTLCDKERAMEIFGFRACDFMAESYAVIPEEYLERIW